jgi:hypothetical protein
MNQPETFVFGSYRAWTLPDGSISYYREILTPDGRELIGKEYPHEGYCWLNLTRSALNAGLTSKDIFQSERAARDLTFNDSYIATRFAEMSRAA